MHPKVAVTIKKQYGAATLLNRAILRGVIYKLHTLLALFKLLIVRKVKYTLLLSGNRFK